MFWQVFKVLALQLIEWQCDTIHSASDVHDNLGISGGQVGVSAQHICAHSSS